MAWTFLLTPLLRRTFSSAMKKLRANIAAICQAPPIRTKFKKLNDPYDEDPQKENSEHQIDKVYVPFSSLIDTRMTARIRF